MDLIQNTLSANQYMNDIRMMSEIKQIVLHHTCGSSADSAVSWWQQTTERVGTNFIIDKDGTVVQCFDLKYWAYHLYVASKNNSIPPQYKTFAQDRRLARASVGIELVSAGELTFKNGQFISSYDKVIPKESVVTYEKPFRDFRFYEAYTKAQLESLSQLLQHLSVLLPHIPTKYNDEMWQTNIEAVKGSSGIWSHVSYRSDKSDCHPQKELIAVLKAF
jgi:N-acetyl-anhydromuramyl-L-alanine amidase AmpD